MANRALGINQAGFRGLPSSSKTASSESQNKSRTPRFKVILDGHIAPNLIQKDVVVQLAKLTHTSTLHATQLLAGKPTTIKSDVSLDTAQRCLITLLEIGVIAHIEPISTLIHPLPSADLVSHEPQPAHVERSDCGVGCLIVGTGDGALRVTRLQLEGRKAVTPEDFLRGYPRIIGATLN